MVKLGDINPQVWDDVTAFMERKLRKYEFNSEDLQFDYKIGAGSRRMDRQLNQQFGIFKGFILHPTTQYLKQIFMDNFTAEVVLGEPLIPTATAVIMLYMMYKRIPLEALVLLACFIFNLNPLYVVTFYILWKLSVVQHKPKQFIRPTVSTRPQRLRRLVDIPVDKTYDYILIGNNISTYYTAALLSKAGQKCLVLLPPDAPATELRVADAPSPVLLDNLSVGKADRYQTLLDAAQDMSTTTRVVLAPIGTAADGYTHTIINRTSKAKGKAKNNVFSLRAGMGSLVEDLGSRLVIDRTKLTEFVGSLVGAHGQLTEYLVTKVCVMGCEAPKKETLDNFNKLAGATCDQLLGAIESIYELCDSLACVSVLSVGEALPSSRISALYLAAAFAGNESGLFHPVSFSSASSRDDLEAVVGNCAITKALASTVLTHGGDVCFAAVKGFVGEDNSVKGVELSEGDVLREVFADKGVVSGLGAIYTYTRLMAGQPLSQPSATCLGLLQEARPKIRVVIWLQASLDELTLCAAEYVEVGSQPRESAEMNTFISSYLRIWSPSARDPGWCSRHPSLQTVVVEFEADDSLVVAKTERLLHAGQLVPGPRVFESVSRNCEDGDSTRDQLYISQGQSARFLEVAESKVLELYPRAAGRVLHRHLHKPHLGGHRVSGCTNKYTALLNASSDIHGLFLCGPDVGTVGLAGEIQGGWIAANAALGYTAAEMQAGRNIVAELRNT